MRLLSVLLLCLIHSNVALPQAKPVLRLKGDVELEGSPNDTITGYKFFDKRNELLLVGQQTVRLLDVAQGKFLETRRIYTPNASEDRERLISSDGRRMIVFGNYTFSNKENKVKRAVTVWDLETGKQIAVLNQTKKPVRAAFWSKNGKILVTSSDQYAPLFVDSTSVEIAFWDGETFELKNSLPSDKVNWWYLTADGARCLFTTAPIENWFFIDRFISGRGSSIKIWDTALGTVIQSLSPAQNAALTITRTISVSPDERYLVYLADGPKVKEPERRLVVREMQPGGSFQYQLKYELPPQPKLSEYGVTFSTDGKYFAFDAGKTLQIYDGSTGKKRFELSKDRVPSYWLNDNQVLLYDYGHSMVAVEIATGRQLYKQELIQVVMQYYRSSEDTIPDNVVIDRTEIVPHPANGMLLTYSNQYVRVYDLQTGELLQTLVQPAIDTTKPSDPKKGPRLSDKTLVWKAGWSGDGKSLYIINSERSSVALWEVIEN